MAQRQNDTIAYLGKTNTKFSKANSRPKPQGTALAGKHGDNKCYSCYNPNEADLEHLKKVNNLVGPNRGYNTGPGYASQNLSQEDRLFLQNSGNQEEESLRGLIGSIAHQTKPCPQLREEEEGRRTSSNERQRVYSRKCRVKKKSLEFIIAGELRSDMKELDVTPSESNKKMEEMSNNTSSAAEATDSQIENMNRNDFLPTLLNGFRFWIPVSAVNFCYELEGLISILYLHCYELVGFRLSVMSMKSLPPALIGKVKVFPIKVQEKTDGVSLFKHMVFYGNLQGQNTAELNSLDGLSLSSSITIGKEKVEETPAKPPACDEEKRTSKLDNA
ncbi:hypothetical protein Ancab_033791 [Ancistrocladus abbreviatus]